MYYKHYPKECFSIDETRTRRNMTAYDTWEDKVEKECCIRRPDYHKMNLRERYQLRQEVKKDIPSPV